MSNSQGVSSTSFLKSFNNGAKDGSNTNSHGSHASEPRIRMKMTNMVPIKQIRGLVCTFFNKRPI